MRSFDASQVATRTPTGGGFTPLGTLGHVDGLTWSDAVPGGPDTLTCTLQVQPTYRHPAFDPGRVVEVYRGGSKIWEGRLAEPIPGDQGWELTAKGAGTYGDAYRAIYTTWNANDAIDQAITRGLRWNKGTISSTGLYLAEPQDSGTLTITDFLTLLTKPGAYTWKIGRRNKLTVFPIPVTPTRLLMSGAPAARSLADYVNALYGRYQSAADNPDTGALATYALAAAANAGSITKHQRAEAIWDLTAAGTLSSGSAGGYVTSALSAYTAASWAGPITVRRGQYLTMTGTPVDLGCEQAGEVCLMMLADGPYGGEVSPSPPVTFPVGRVEYSDTEQTLAITPYQSVASDLSSLLDVLALGLPKPAVTDA